MTQQSDFQFSASSSSSESTLVRPINMTEDICVLKHLSDARQILEGQTYDQQHNGRCLFGAQLDSIPQYLIPMLEKQQDNNSCSIDNKKKDIPKKINFNNRLSKLQQNLSEYQILRDNVHNLLGNRNNLQIKQFSGSLWSLYSPKEPSYSRFGNTFKKNNFANVIMNVNGIVIPLSNKNKFHLQTKQNEKNNSKFILSPDSIRFDSHFQSGNLLFAYRCQDTQIESYDLILQNDTNTKGHNQWFYFKIKNTKKHNRIKFNIINFTKNQSLFSYGIKPLTFSERAHNNQRVGWVRNGEKINYYPNKISRETNIYKSFYTASFEYYFRQVDTVYFAPNHPYLYTQLSTYLNGLLEYAEHFKNNHRKLNPLENRKLSYFNRKYQNNQHYRQIFTVKSLTETIARNSVPIITISMGKKMITDADCKIVWIFGRQHPAETTASYMVEGVINYLLQLYRKPSNEYKRILDRIIFKIVPLINADGVIHGNTRAQLTGVDPNRMWKKPLKRLCPEISALKKAISQTKNNISLVIDLHSHSKKFGCFFYGNSLMYDPKATKIYPTLVCQADNRFSLKNCRFRGGYQTTARSVLFHQLSIPHVYTVQCSLLGHLQHNRVVQFKLQDYHNMGKTLIKVFLDLELTKMTKKQAEIILDLGDRIPQRDDADSARSQSSLSQEQYEQIHSKKHKNKQKMKIRKCVNDHSHHNKYFIGKNNQTLHKNSSATIDKINEKQSSFINLRAMKLRMKQNKQNKFLKHIRSATSKNNPLNQSSNSKLKNTKDIVQSKRSVQIHLTIPKILLRNQCKERIQQAHNRQRQKVMVITQTKNVEIQVNYQNSSEIQSTKNRNKTCHEQQYLCVVGSSIEDELFSIFKNEVGLQVYPEILDEASTKNQNQRKIVKQKSLKSTKMPKLLNYLCSNLIGAQKQNSIFPTGKKFQIIKNRKLI